MLMPPRCHALPPPPATPAPATPPEPRRPPTPVACTPLGARGTARPAPRTRTGPRTAPARREARHAPDAGCRHAREGRGELRDQLPRTRTGPRTAPPPGGRRGTLPTPGAGRHGRGAGNCATSSHAPAPDHEPPPARREARHAPDAGCRHARKGRGELRDQPPRTRTRTRPHTAPPEARPASARYAGFGAACCTTSNDHSVALLAAGAGRSPPSAPPPSPPPPPRPWCAAFMGPSIQAWKDSSSRHRV